MPAMNLSQGAKPLEYQFRFQLDRMARQAPPQARQKRSPVAASEDNRWSSPPPRRALLSHLGNKCHGLLQQPLSHGGGRMTRRFLRGIPTPPPLSPNAIRTLEERPLRQGESGHDPAALVPALRSKAVDGECTARIDDYGRKNAPRSEGDQGQPRASSDLSNSDSRSGRRTDERKSEPGPSGKVDTASRHRAPSPRRAVPSRSCHLTRVFPASMSN